jgi:hypothetical protein
MDGREEEDLWNIQVWITNLGVHDWQLDRNSDDIDDSDDNAVND